LPHDDHLRLYLAHRAALIEYAAPLVGCRARAEDVVQEAWIRFATAAGRGQADAGIVHPVAYLYRIVRNLSVDWTRRLAVEATPGEQGDWLAGVPSPAASPERETAARADLRVVAEALADLPDPRGSPSRCIGSPG